MKKIGMEELKEIKENRDEFVKDKIKEDLKKAKPYSKLKINVRLDLTEHEDLYHKINNGEVREFAFDDDPDHVIHFKKLKTTIGKPKGKYRMGMKHSPNVQRDMLIKSINCLTCTINRLLNKIEEQEKKSYEPIASEPVDMNIHRLNALQCGKKCYFCEIYGKPENVETCLKCMEIDTTNKVSYFGLNRNWYKGEENKGDDKDEHNS